MIFKGSPKNKKVLWTSILGCSYKCSLCQDGLQHRAGGRCSPHSQQVEECCYHCHTSRGSAHGIQHQEAAVPMV